MLRLAGALLLFFSCGGLGIWTSNQLKERIRQLKILEKISTYLYSQIAYAHTPLPEAIEYVGKKQEAIFSKWLIGLAQDLGQYSGEEYATLLKRSMEENLKETCLQKEDLENCYQAWGNLGELDQAHQLQILQNYGENQKNLVKHLEEEYLQKRKVYQSLGFLTGAFLVILLL